MHNNIVFFDIDGTLVDDEKNIPASAKKAVETLKNNGVYVAIATGRAPFMFENIRKELEIESFVSFNGQYVVFEGETIYENPIGREPLKKLYEASAAKEHPMVFMCDQDMRATTAGHPYIKQSLAKLKLDYPLVDTDYFRNKTIYQALLFCERDEEAFIKQHDDLHFIRWHDYSCDVLPGGGSKAVGVNKIIKAAGLDKKHAFAFGDGFNDLEMVQEVGTGIAMGNAVLPLKEAADYMTASVEEDGILKGLEYFGLV
jgi:Cof subfamily protein (haloacid dehalogenase superfamily)